VSGSAGRQPPWADLDERVRALAPTSPSPRLSAFLEATQAAPDARVPGPFAPDRLEAIGTVSAALLAEPALARDPAAVAGAYWMRPAQLARLQVEFERRAAADPSVIRVPVGRVLHLAPANVDTLFLYSWVLSFLCGNANVVRLSQDPGPLVPAMLGVVDRVGRDRPVLRERDLFVTYAHEERTTTALSAWCSHRVLWGGDETVRALRALPLNPDASERTFGTKFSYAVIAASPYVHASTEVRDRLARSFFNDLFSFDQMACSSPHVVFWLDPSGEIDRAVPAFEDGLQREVERRKYAPSAASAVQRRAFAFALAASAEMRVALEHSGFVGVRVADPSTLDRETCGGGLIRHCPVSTLDAVVAFAREGDQTVTHFGLEPPELRALASGLGRHGVDRLVPVGEALTFDAVWDGYDLLEDFTRRVRVRSE
jgi:hypothetical protein